MSSNLIVGLRRRQCASRTPARSSPSSFLLNSSMAALIGLPTVVDEFSVLPSRLEASQVPPTAQSLPLSDSQLLHDLPPDLLALAPLLSYPVTSATDPPARVSPHLPIVDSHSSPVNAISPPALVTYGPITEAEHVAKLKHQSQFVSPFILWANRFSSSLRNLKQMAVPSTLDDGVPTVVTPESIRLQPSDTWKDHILAQFHGSPPSAGKIFSDMNPIWGVQGRISVRNYSNQTCLIYVPCELTRKWIVDVAFWQAGYCSFSASMWSQSADLAPAKLEVAPVWVIIRNIPPQLYSLEGLSVIGSGIGEPLYIEKPTLDPIPRTVAKIKVKVVLDRKQPASVRVKDKFGNFVTVNAVYPRLPPQCERCKDFGHMGLRCPSSISPPKSSNVGLLKAKEQAPLALKLHLQTPSVDKDRESSSQSSSKPLILEKGSAILNLPPRSTSPSSRAVSDGEGWTLVARKSRIKQPSEAEASSSHFNKSLTSSQHHVEEDVIKIAQRVLRNRSCTRPPEGPSGISASAKKRSKLKQRKQVLQAQSGSFVQSLASSHQSKASVRIGSGLGLRGRSPARLDPPNHL